MLTIAGECAGAFHEAGIWGHEAGAPAAFYVRSECPGCGDAQAASMCAGRVHWGLGAYATAMECPVCGEVGEAAAFWREVVPLAAAVPAGEVEAPSMSNGQLLEAFREHLESRGRAAGTIRLRLQHVAALAAAHELATVTPEALDQWAIDQGAGRAPATVNSQIKSLRAFYGWADRYGVIRPNPATLLDLVPNPQREARVIDDDTYRRALEGATPQLRAMLMLGRLGGLRLSEFTQLHTDNDGGEWLTIIGKGSKQRRVYVVPVLRAALDAIRPAGGGYYFPGRFSGHMHAQSVAKMIKRETGFNAHALRHAAGTAVYAATKDLRATQAFLGHSQPTTTAIYVHVDADDLQRVTLAGAAR